MKGRIIFHNRTGGKIIFKITNENLWERLYHEVAFLAESGRGVSYFRGVIMSREIKFRVWDKKNKKYRELGVYGVANGKVVVRFPIETLLKGDYILEQCTGLTDKNGKDIYEGDVIQCYLSPISSTKFTGVVEFRPGCIMFKNFADGGAYAFNRLGAIEAVIGNVHENPELLGGGNVIY